MFQARLLLHRGSICSFSILRYYKTLINAVGLPARLPALSQSQYCFTKSTSGPEVLSSIYVQSTRDRAICGDRTFSIKSSPNFDVIKTRNRFQTSESLNKEATSQHALVEQSSQKNIYHNIVDAFPSGIQMAFAYGSGAIQQSGNQDMKKNMLDFIFVVDRPRLWHQQNLKKHPHHYSFLRYLGPHTLSRVQERYGAGVYFNTLVPMEGRLIKYGVISTARLIADLLDWDTLYIAGRLHKPITLIALPTDENLITAMKINLQSAVHAALLLLPDMFSEEQLYTRIASLSYAGDFRMTIAEDRNKISNIVKPSIELFRRMYGPFLLGQDHMTWWQAEGQIEQALTFTSRHHHLTRLPSQVLYGMLKRQYQIGVFPDLEEMIQLKSHDADCAAHVAQSIRLIVQKSSMSQSIKGILTAGLIKSLRYSSKKVLKKIRS